MKLPDNIMGRHGMQRIRRIHFVGIGGSGMSGIAEVLINLGYQVSGSDIHAGPATQRLMELGVEFNVGHHATHVQTAEVVVISSAVSESNEEVVAAREAKIPVIPRAEMLAELMRFRYGIAVAGTHGKTTTTSLVASLLAEGGMDPTFVIGGCLNSAGVSAQLGQSAYLVAEADESDASFLYLQPMIAVVTNIDADHMETYQGQYHLLEGAFIEFLHHLPFYGMAVMCLDDPGVRDVLPKLSKPVKTYGTDPQADVQAVDIQPTGLKTCFGVKRPGHDTDLNITLNMPGRHNMLNALAAITVATELGVADQDIAHCLAEFKGVGRRFQTSTVQFKGAMLPWVDDYGHHPSEIAATLEAVRQTWPKKRLLLVYQPHRYSRTRDLFEDFVQELSKVDALVLLEVYAAGELLICGADGRSLSRAIRVRGQVDPVFLAEQADWATVLASMLEPDDVLVTMGAGSVGQLAAELTARLASVQPE